MFTRESRLHGDLGEVHCRQEAQLVQRACGRNEPGLRIIKVSMTGAQLIVTGDGEYS